MLHGARVALRQAVLSAKFWPYACKHFCHARNIELREGQRAHSARFDGKEFDGTILPFGCLIDFFPTPPRKKTRRSQKDDVVLGDGEEYALPATDGELVDVEVGFDEDGNLEWIDDGDEAKEGIDIALHGKGRLSCDAECASIHQVKKIYGSPKEQWTCPMMAVYDKQTRSVCINDLAMQASAPKQSEKLDASDMLDLEDLDEIFALDEQSRMTDEDIRLARKAELRAESSHGGGVDYWEYDPGTRKCTYHVFVPRKAMVHPSKTLGSIGDPPDPGKLSSVRVSHVRYKDRTPITTYEDSYTFGKTRLMQPWTGSVEFFDDGLAPSKKKLPFYQGSDVLGGDSGLPYIARAFRVMNDHIVEQRSPTRFSFVEKYESG